MTLLLFIYYCNDITAEMTSGPADIPVRTFEDAVHHDYRILADSSFLVGLLAKSEPGTAKHDIFEMHFKAEDGDGYRELSNMEESIQEMISDDSSKTLFYAQRITVVP